MHASLAIVDFSKHLSATCLAPRVHFNTQLQTMAPHQNNFVDVSKDCMAPAAIVLRVGLVIGARVMLNGRLAPQVPAQHPQFRAASRSADAKRAGSPWQLATPPTGAICAFLDGTKQIMAMMVAFCLVPSMPCHTQGLCRQTIVFATMEHTRWRRLRRATVAAVMRL